MKNRSSLYPASSWLIPKRQILTVVIFAALLTLPFLSLTPFFTHGEPREALVAQAMLKTHNWILPSRYGDEFATKPPFMHWLVALFSLPQGEVNEFTARLPGALLSILATCSLFYFVSKGCDSALALLACFILLGSGGWHMEALSARLDMTLSALMFMGLCALYFWEESKLKGLPLLPILLFTAATLTKGPVAIVLPAIILFGYLIIFQYRLQVIVLSVGKVFIPVTCLSFVWYYLAYRSGGQAFLDMVLSENVGRFASTMKIPTHVHTIWHLYGTLLLGLVPTSIILLFLPPYLLRWLRNGSFNRIKTSLSCVTRKNLQKMKKAHLYSLLVVLSSLVFFSVPSSKRHVYLLSIYPFLCIPLAHYLRTLIAEKSVALKRSCNSFLWFIVLAYGLTFIFLSRWINLDWFLWKEKHILRYQYFTEAFGQSLHAMTLMESVVFILPLLLSLLLIYCQRKGNTFQLKHLVGVSYGAYLTVLVMVNGIILPTIGTSLSPKSFAQTLSAPAAELDQIYSFREKFYVMKFYLGNKLRLYCEGEKLEQTNYFLVLNKHFPGFNEAFKRDYKVEVLHRSPGAITNSRRRLFFVKLTRKALSSVSNYTLEDPRT